MNRPALPRSISSADLQRTSNCITYIERDLCEYFPKGTVNYFKTTPSFTLTIPHLREYPKEFREYVFRRLVDYGVKEDLESGKVINWCPDASTFTPLSTTGDGNCLLHAASLGMWGFQDRAFILRKAVHSALKSKEGSSLYPRWMAWYKKEMSAYGVKLERDQWAKEWASVVEGVSMEKKGGVLLGLDQFHIFVLANVLRRPIVVYSLPKIQSAAGGVTLQNLNFHGLYLPLLWEPRECKKVPLPIAFNGGHYVSLAVIEGVQQYKDGRLLLPLAEYNGTEFPVMFKLPEESDRETRRAYLDIVYTGSHGYKGGVVCAEMVMNEVPAYMKPLLSGFIDKCFDAYQYDKKYPTANQTRPSPPTGSDTRPKCRNGCGFFGNPALNGYCSVCHKKQKPVESSSISGGSSLRCCNGCDKPGLPDRLGMCEECYHSKKTGGVASSQGSRSSSQSAPVEDIKACISPGCEFNGTKERNFYCSQCYNKAMSGGDRRRSSSVKQEFVLGRTLKNTPERHSTYSDAPKCPECREFFGSIEYGGVCHGCFIKSTGQFGKPDKCKKCKEFYGAKEFGGYCNACFMKMTEEKVDSAPLQDTRPPHAHQPTDKPVDHVRKERDERHRLKHHDSSGSVPHMNALNDDKKLQDVHKPLGNTSAAPDPVHLRLQNPIAVTPGSCFICDGSQPIAISNVICQQHAIKVRQMWAEFDARSEQMRGGGVSVARGLPSPVDDEYCEAKVLSSGVDSRATPLRYSREPEEEKVRDSGVDEAGRRQSDVKLLCRTPGCSYYPISEFNYYCKDCFDTKKPTLINF